MAARKDYRWNYPAIAVVFGLLLSLSLLLNMMFLNGTRTSFDTRAQTVTPASSSAVPDNVLMK